MEAPVWLKPAILGCLVEGGEFSPRSEYSTALLGAKVQSKERLNRLLFGPVERQVSVPPIVIPVAILLLVVAYAAIRALD